MSEILHRKKSVLELMQVYYIKNYPGLKPTEYIRLLLIKTGWESGGKNEVKDKEAFNSFSKGKLQQLIR